MRLTNWYKIEFIFAHKLNTSPVDLRQLEFYTIQLLLKEYEEYIDRENKEYEKQQREAERKSGANSGTNFGGFKVPKFDVPKFNVPKY